MSSKSHPWLKQSTHFAIAALVVCALALSSSQSRVKVAQAQSPVPFPLLPLIAEYECPTYYFMQWINDHPQYALIEGSVTDGKQPIYSLVLTEKASRRRITYSNLEARVKGLTSAGQEARLTKIEYHATSKFGQAPAHEFSFTDERGQAIRWRFTLAAAASEHNAGLRAPEGGGSNWLFIYHELGTTAGEGTAVQIGNKVCEAEAWPEISAPPYFVAYRGVYSESMGIGSVFTGQESWSVTASPQNLNEGAQWTLADERGRTRQWRVAARRGDELTINEVGPPSAATRSLLARQTAGGLALRSITITNGPKAIRFSFTPDLDLASSASIAFQIDENGHNKVAYGSVAVERKGSAAQLRWQPKAPDWAKARVLNTAITINATGYKLEVK